MCGTRERECPQVVHGAGDTDVRNQGPHDETGEERDVLQAYVSRSHTDPGACVGMEEIGPETGSRRRIQNDPAAIHGGDVDGGARSSTPPRRGPSTPRTVENFPASPSTANVPLLESSLGATPTSTAEPPLCRQGTQETYNEPVTPGQVEVTIFHNKHYLLDSLRKVKVYITNTGVSSTPGLSVPPCLLVLVGPPPPLEDGLSPFVLKDGRTESEVENCGRRKESGRVGPVRKVDQSRTN